MRRDDDSSNNYDFVIIGTGLAETGIGTILSKSGKYRVLHIDTNSMYGSEFSTYKYRQIERYFGNPESEMLEELLEVDREFNIDLTPKLILRESKLKDFLIEQGVDNLVSFGLVLGSYFYYKKLHSIPVSEIQALKSSAISLLQKHRVMKFFYHVQKYNKDNSVQLKKTMKEEFEYFGLNENSINFIGHAIALNLNDDYLDMDPRITYEKIRKYVLSITYYEKSESPFIYPIYGLSELCQALARVSSTYGGVFMLNAKIEKIDGSRLEIVDPNGERQKINCKKIIGNPNYFEDSIISKKIIRCVLICRRKENQISRNIIFFKKDFGRKNDIFCVVLGNEESACPLGYEICLISTVQENEKEEPEKEIGKVLSMFTILRKFIDVREVRENIDTPHLIFTKGIDESPIMDNIYEDIERIKIKLKTEFDID